MISSDFFPNSGGIAIHVYELCQYLAKQGHEVFLISGSYSENSKFPTFHENVTLISHYKYKMTHYGQIKCAMQSLRSARIFQKKISPDIVHWHNLTYESLVVRLVCANSIKIFTNHSSGFTRRLAHWWRKKFQLPFLLSPADAVISPSKARVGKTRECYSGVVSYIPNGVDTEFYKPVNSNDSLKEKLGIFDSDFIIIAAVRAEYVKGVDRVISSLARIKVDVPNAKLIIFGAGNSENDLKRQAIDSGLAEKVIFCGGVSKEKIVDYYSLAHVSVMMSREEGGVPYTALESLACGIPLVANNVGGLIDLKECKKAVQILAMPDELDAALRRHYNLLTKERGEISKIAVDFVSNAFSIYKNGRETEELYLSLLRS